MIIRAKRKCQALETERLFGKNAATLACSVDGMALSCPPRPQQLCDLLTIGCNRKLPLSKFSITTNQSPADLDMRPGLLDHKATLPLTSRFEGLRPQLQCSSAALLLHLLQR